MLRAVLIVHLVELLAARALVFEELSVRTAQTDAIRSSDDIAVSRARWQLPERLTGDGIELPRKGIRALGVLDFVCADEVLAVDAELRGAHDATSPSSSASIAARQLRQ
jgi:hypothetical protein